MAQQAQAQMEEQQSHQVDDSSVLLPQQALQPLNIFR